MSTLHTISGTCIKRNYLFSFFSDVFYFVHLNTFVFVHTNTHTQRIKKKMCVWFWTHCLLSIYITLSVRVFKLNCKSIEYKHLVCFFPESVLWIAMGEVLVFLSVYNDSSLAKVFEEWNEEYPRDSLRVRHGPGKESMNPLFLLSLQCWEWNPESCTCWTFSWRIFLFYLLVWTAPLSARQFTTNRRQWISQHTLRFSGIPLSMYELEGHRGNLHTICIRCGICS